MYSQKETIKIRIHNILQVIRMYDWLLDFYILDFFVDNHWSRLPASWRESFVDLDPLVLGNVLLGVSVPKVFPLSFLAMLASVKAYSLPRKYSNMEAPLSSDDIDSCASHPRLKNLFLKHVKLKKRHEISLMAEVVKQTAVKSKCDAVLDIGSGLGHLVRVLAYKNNLYAAGIECQSQLTDEARKLDQELEYTAKKHLSAEAMSKIRRPTHLNLTLSTTDQLDQLDLPETMQNYGTIGLHPCGDLGPLLLKHFVHSNKVKFICVVGCCYMKLSSEGYPMSEFLSGLNNALSYQSREIACHAIEVYCERLRQGDYKDLKIHAYRATLERILVEHDPALKHAGVRSIKHSDNMTFAIYTKLALERLSVPIPTCHSVITRAHHDLSQWRRVVTLYSLRLALAPLVETLVLLDRVLFVLEHGLSCEIRPVFDPKLSPRNHIIVAQKS